MSKPTRVKPVKYIHADEAVEKFFRLRWKYKTRENDPGYFAEWVHRFESGAPERWADYDSLAAIRKLRKQGYVWGA